MNTVLLAWLYGAPLRNEEVIPQLFRMRVNVQKSALSTP
jgi:hypothetical protein